MKRNSGFTLLEIIVVIIIISILASLALPRFFRTVEYSRASEALAAIGTIRQAMERCYLKTGDFANCQSISNSLDIAYPGEADPDTVTDNPAALFNYTLAVDQTNLNYVIEATRDTVTGGDGTSTINIDRAGVRTGGGVFSGI